MENITELLTFNPVQVPTQTMNNYPQSKYPNLYEEIVKEHNFRYGKFHPIPYPMINDNKHKRINQTRNN